MRSKHNPLFHTFNRAAPDTPNNSILHSYVYQTPVARPNIQIPNLQLPNFQMPNVHMANLQMADQLNSSPVFSEQVKARGYTSRNRLQVKDRSRKIPSLEKSAKKNTQIKAAANIAAAKKKVATEANGPQEVAANEPQEVAANGRQEVEVNEGVEVDAPQEEAETLRAEEEREEDEEENE